MTDPVVIPLGVSDLEGRIGAIDRGNFDIDQINLLSGEVIGHWPGLGTPLMVDGRYLIGWQSGSRRHHLRLFRIDLSLQRNAAAQEKIEFSGIFELPEWVNPHSNSPVDFALKFRRENDVYVLYYKARKRLSRGGPPPVQGDAGGLVILQRVEFDIATLEIGNQRQQDGFEEEQVAARRGEHLARNGQGFVYRQAGKLQNAPWSIDEGERSLRSQGKAGEKRQTLSIFEGSDIETGKIFSMQADQLHLSVPELSLDGRHLAIVENERGADNETLNWRIYNSHNGQMIFSMPYQESLRSFRIFSRRLLFHRQIQSEDGGITIAMKNFLCSMDISKNSLMWCHEGNRIELQNTKFLPPNY